MPEHTTRMSEAPAIVIVNKLLLQACSLRASDIHLEPFKESLCVRFRIDGILYVQPAIEKKHMLQVLSRLKVLAHTNVAEKRMPQDGKFSYVFDTRSIDCRLATFPCVYGEKIVIRLLDRTTALVSLHTLGLSTAMAEQVLKMSTQSQGFFLVTGPTGSGKTTTLHALLSTLKTTDKNIVTLEDPIEYHIEGITQGQIFPEIGFTFECGVRALLRQDPDIIMVGEIRDKKTGQVAIQAALTGHLVLSTLHTNDTISTLMRLLDMGIEPFLINAALSGVLAQRLVRKLCIVCRIPTVLSESQALIIKKYNLVLEQVFTSTGCSECQGTGHKGRIGIFELLLVTHELRSLITQQPAFNALYNQAIQDGMRSFLYDATDKINQGSISLDEFIRSAL